MDEGFRPWLRPFSPELGSGHQDAAGRAGADVGDLLVPDRPEGHQPDRAPAPECQVPRPVLECHLAGGGAERAHRARRERAVRPSHRALAACPGPSRTLRRGQARGGRQPAGVPDAHHQEGARRGDDRARERPHHAGDRRRDGAVRRPVRHGVGRLSRAGRDRHDRLGHARQGGGPGRRGADHDRHRPCRRAAGGHGLQLADPLQPRADRQARRLRLRAADLPVDGPAALQAGPGRKAAAGVVPLAAVK